MAHAFMDVIHLFGEAMHITATFKLNHLNWMGPLSLSLNPWVVVSHKTMGPCNDVLRGDRILHEAINIAYILWNVIIGCGSRHSKFENATNQAAYLSSSLFK